MGLCPRPSLPFFHSSLAPTVEIGAIWPPKGIEVLNPWKIGLLNMDANFLANLSLAFKTYIVSSNLLFFPLCLKGSDSLSFSTQWLNLQSCSNNPTSEEIANIAATLHSLSLTGFFILLFFFIGLVSIWLNLSPEGRTQVKNTPSAILLFVGLAFLLFLCCFLYSMSTNLI